MCYPYAWGRLDASLNLLANNLRWECMKKDIEIDDKVVDMLQGMIKDLQEKAVVESYEHA